MDSVPVRLGRAFFQKPIPGVANKLVTTALPYVNNVPHLGNIIGSVLSGDVYARFERLRGSNCLFLGGTDEYGTATEFKAFQEKSTPMEICNKYFPSHADTYRWLHIDFDVFGRTTNRHHKGITQEIYLSLKENGYIFEQSGMYTYCPECERFLADRFVHGVCPKCRYDDARGDQCDKCGALFNSPQELVRPVCNYCGHDHVTQRASTHAFLDLPKLEGAVRAGIPGSVEEANGRWTANAYSITQSWLKKGLAPRCISRDLKWGIPVPEMSGEKVFYVWFDAPIGYISITQELMDLTAEKEEEEEGGGGGGDGGGGGGGGVERMIAGSWRDWWIRDDTSSEKKGGGGGVDVELIQFMGKDNVPFHTILFPAMLLGARRPQGAPQEARAGGGFVTMRKISATEYLSYEGGKFSKSRGEGIFGPDMMHTGIEADLWRFYLLQRRPESSDSSFVWKEFEALVNGVLVDQYGNLVLRCQNLFYAHLLCRGHTGRGGGNDAGGADAAGGGGGGGRLLLGEMGGALPAVTKDALEKELSCFSLIDSYTEHMGRFQFRAALEVVFQLVGGVNRLLSSREPWKQVRSEDAREREAGLLNICMATSAMLTATVLLHPFIPGKAGDCLSSFGLLREPALLESVRLDTSWELVYQIDRKGLLAQQAKAAPLFKRIDVSELQRQFKPPPRRFRVENVGGAIAWPFVLVHLSGLRISRVGDGAFRAHLESVRLSRTDEQLREERRSAYVRGRRECRVDDGAFPLSPEALESSGVPSINVAVDLYNAHSVSSMTVCGLYDAGNIVGDTLRYMRATGQEPFVAIGRKAAAAMAVAGHHGGEREGDGKWEEEEGGSVGVHEGDWVLVDEASNVITLALTKQSARVAVTVSTTECVMCCQGSPAHTVDGVLQFAKAVAGDITRFCGGDFAVITSSSAEV